MVKTGRETGTVQTVDRAMEVLKLLARRGSAGVTEVATELGIHKSNVHRVLATLAKHGLVDREADTEKYRLGFGLVGLASAVTSEIDAVRHARGPAQRLSESIGETVIVTALIEDKVVVVHQATPSATVLSVDWSGSRMPLHCTPGGKVLLTYLSEQELKQVLSDSLQRFTDNTVTDPEALRRQLLDVREAGYAYTIEELEMGLNGVAAPVFSSGVFSSGGEAVAALGVYGPAFRLPANSLAKVGRLTKIAADEISRRIGFNN